MAHNNMARLPPRLDYAHVSDTPGAAYYQVLLDGQKLDHCLEANAKEGWAVVYDVNVVIDDEGIHVSADDAIKTHTVYGKVEIVLKPNE